MEEIVQFSVPLSQRQACCNRSNQRIISHVRVVDLGLLVLTVTQNEITSHRLREWVLLLLGTSQQSAHILLAMLRPYNHFKKVNKVNISPLKNGISVSKTVTLQGCNLPSLATSSHRNNRSAAVVSPMSEGGMFANFSNKASDGLMIQCSSAVFSTIAVAANSRAESATTLGLVTEFVRCTADLEPCFFTEL